jgi:hypothetical protein
VAHGQGDADLDGDVDGDDFLIWQQQTGVLNIMPRFSITPVNVPEPSSGLPASVMLLLAGCRRRSRAPS